MRKFGMSMVMVGLLAGASLQAGCGVVLVPTRQGVSTSGAVEVSLLGVSGNIFRFVVWNRSPAPMVVNRDLVVMSTATGVRQRVPGGAGSVYTIPPGASHNVNVRYILGGMQPGEQVNINFQGAVTINGALVPVEPISFVAQ